MNLTGRKRNYGSFTVTEKFKSLLYFNTLTMEEFISFTLAKTKELLGRERMAFRDDFWDGQFSIQMGRFLVMEIGSNFDYRRIDEDIGRARQSQTSAQHVIDTNPGGVAGPIRIATFENDNAGGFVARELPETEIDEHKQAVESAAEAVRKWRNELGSGEATQGVPHGTLTPGCRRRAGLGISRPIPSPRLY